MKITRKYNVDYYIKILVWKFSYYLVSIGITFITSYLSLSKLYTILLFPFLSRGFDSNFIFTRVHEGFETSILICILFSFYWTFPYALYLWWSFIVPSFYKFERRKISLLCIFVLLFQLFLWPCCLWLLEESISFFTSFEVTQNHTNLQSGQNTDLQFGKIEENNYQIHYTPHVLFYIQFVFSFCFTFQILTFFVLWCIRKKSIRSSLERVPRSVAWSCLFLTVAFCVPPDIFFQLVLSICCCIMFEVLIFISLCEKEYEIEAIRFQSTTVSPRLNV